MPPEIIGVITIALLLPLIILGIHVALALGVLSILGMWWITGNLNIALNLVGNTAYATVNDYVFGVAPMFMLMGLLANLSGSSDDAYNAAQIIFRRIRGGIAMATVMANAIFAAITGTSVASAAIFSKIAVPQMERLGYQRRFSLGTVTGSSVLGMLIPPSYYLIVYGIVTEESIGKLFVAGVGPGLVLLVVYIIGIVVMGKLRPETMGELPEIEGFDSQMVSTFLKPWPIVVLVALVIGGIYGGFFTPTEAGGIGAAGALVLAIAKKRMNKNALWDVVMETGYTTASIYFLIITAAMYSRMLTISGLPSLISGYVAALDVAPLVIIIAFCMIFIVLGAFLDGTSIMVLSIPLMYPIVTGLGFDAIWFGVLTVFACEMGLLTPPFGLCVFVVKSAVECECTVEDIFFGAFPFLIMMTLVLCLLLVFPGITLWLVRQM